MNQANYAYSSDDGRDNNDVVGDGKDCDEGFGDGARVKNYVVVG